MKIADQKQTITSQAARCHQLDEENRQLREQIFHLKAIQPTLLSVKSSGLEKADATTTRTLNSRLEDIGLPSDIAEKLSARSITKVFDLIRLSESQLSRIDGITPIDLDTIVTTLRLVGSPSGAASFCAGTSYQGTEAWWIVNKRSIHQNGGKIKAYVQIMHTWYSRDAF